MACLRLPPGQWQADVQLRDHPEFPPPAARAEQRLLDRRRLVAAVCHVPDPVADLPRAFDKATASDLLPCRPGGAWLARPGRPFDSNFAKLNLPASSGFRPFLGAH
ncbi:hypothetical protein NpNSSI1_00010322 [Neofusicoccum parvum]|nr:hypothetical protein NpNSSI1_00010322 [Neofusicoccum parvum]